MGGGTKAAAVCSTNMVVPVMNSKPVLTFFEIFFVSRAFRGHLSLL
jgi:hypothetical protein